MPHFMDKRLTCKRCRQEILVKHNQVGGFWHLNGWANKQGVSYWGGYCSPCFGILHEEDEDESNDQPGSN